MPRKSPLEVVKQQIKTEYETTDAKSRELAERYNVNHSTIRSWISREKWKKPGKKLRKRITKQRKKILKENENDKLTEKERLFCLYYTRDPVAGSAAKKAGFSEKCSYEIGYQLLQKPIIRAEIKRLKKIKFESILLEAEDIVEKHMRIAFSDITDFLEFGRIEVPVMGPFGPVKTKVTITDENGEPREEEVTLTKTVNDVRFKESSEVDGGIISEVKVGRDGASIKLHDAQKSLEWLEKYFEWNPNDKHKKLFDQKKLEISQKELELKEQEMKTKNW